MLLMMFIMYPLRIAGEGILNGELSRANMAAQMNDSGRQRLFS